ncbi:MAG: V-type ATP synthase subunit A [Chlamydia sp.]
MNRANISQNARGTVRQTFGNLIHVEFQGHIRQGEVAYVLLPQVQLKAEVIEIAGAEAKLQVFEDTRDIKAGTLVEFQGDLLEAELGPGLLSMVYDGLQNPLEEVAKKAGYFLPRGIYLSAIDRERKWEYLPKAEVGTTITRGSLIGTTLENRFTHHIMVPFSWFGSYTITWVIPQGSYTANTVIAKAIDEHGIERSITMIQKWPIKNQLIEGTKVRPEAMMDTGSRIIDTQFPIMKGGTFCTPGPFGAGKTVLQHHLSKYSSVDIVIIVACGERAGEVVEVVREFPHLIDPHTGDTLMKRTVIICNTSSMPVAAREASVYLGVTIGEYYRQMGLDVLLLADSTSRWAQAMREMSGRLEEIPGEEAFPAYLSSRIASFYERSGVVSQDTQEIQGSLTIGGSVSPAGGNFEEPVTQATLSVVGTFLGLSRERSDARRYPAIDPLISWSKYTRQVASLLEAVMPSWGQIGSLANKIIREGDEIKKRMEVVGEEGIGIDDMVTYLQAELYDFCYLQQNAFDKEDLYCPLKRQISMLSLLGTILEKQFHFSTHDDARSFFLSLQNKIKNINYLPFESERYKAIMQEIIALISAL